MAIDLLPLSILGIWLANDLLSWVGMVRHAWRARMAHREIRIIHEAGINGFLAFAAESNLLNERFRCAMKMALLVFSWLTTTRFLDRVAAIEPLLDGRDLVGPLIILVALLLLTYWSQLDAQRRPTFWVSEVLGDAERHETDP